MTRTGIVLSGGGARAIAHLGVLQALEEQGIRPTAIAGSSAGALIGALYAAGRTPVEIKEIFHDTAYFGLSHLRVRRPGLFDMDAMRSVLETHLPVKTFEELPIRLFVAATNLTLGRSEILSTGELLQPLLASACVPVIFEPIVYQGCEWVDAGVLNNFPVEPLISCCDRIIGSHVNRLSDRMPAARTLRKTHILERCFHLAIARQVYEHAAECDIFLDHPDLVEIGMFDSKKANRIFRLGYEYARRTLPAGIKSLGLPVSGQ